MEHLRIYFFGSFRLYRDGVLLTSKDWQIRHARQLFKLLFTERGHTVSVDKVIDLLWPYSAEHAHKTLRSAISILRNVLEPTREPQAPSRFVLRGSTGYTLHLPEDNSVWIDTLEFERLLNGASVGNDSPKRRRILEFALQLYTGDYLAEDEQESWAITERTRLRERYFTYVLALMESQRKLGLYNDAILVGRRALNIDVCREQLYPLIMYCQATLGDTVGALQTFEQCRQELHNRLGIDPSPHTLKLHTELLQGEFRTKYTKSLHAVVKQNARLPHTDPLIPALRPTQSVDEPECTSQEQLQVVHKEQLTWLTHQLQDLKEAQQQSARIVALAGEMGVGKSFLLHNIFHVAQTLQIKPLHIVCMEMEQHIAFAPLIAVTKIWMSKLSNDALNTLPRPILATLAHLLPELPTRIPTLVPTLFLCPQQIQDAFTAAFVDLLTILCNQRPLLVLVDDVQWADKASLDVLHRIAQSSITAEGAELHRALLIVLAYRPEELIDNMVLNTMLLSLGRNDSFYTLHLSRFSPCEVEAYVHTHDTVHVLSPEQIHEETQGNALFLTEAVHILLEQKEHYLLEQKLHKNNLVKNALLRSQRIRDGVLARIARLPQRAVELLEYASVIGRPFPPSLLSPNLSVEDYKALDVLLARRFLFETDGDNHEVYLAFVYEIVAHIVYTNCSAIKRSLLHRSVAEQLAGYYANTLYTHATEIAAHYRHAGPQYQTQALHYEVQVQSCLEDATSKIR